MAAGKKNTAKKIKVSPAETTGAAADKITPLAGVAREAPPPVKSMKKGKLLPKNKHRLPRWQKKAQQKAADHL